MKIFFLFMTSIMLLSCNQKHFDSKEELLGYLQNEDNGYIQQKTVNGVDFGLMYRPTDLVVSQMLESKSLNNVDSLRKEYDNYLYFNLSISKNGQEVLSTIPGNRIDFSMMVKRLAFGMKEKIYLYTDENDTIPIIDYIYPRMFGTSNSTSMLFVYPSNKINNAKQLFFSVKDMGFETGDIKFKIAVNIIIDQPNINFKNNESNF